VKDQYFGDVNDYRKYGLLRAILSCTGIRLGVCWMLTAPDGRSDGGHLNYFNKPGKFRRYDSELFDWLTQTHHRHPDRRTDRIEGSELLGGAVYFSELLSDGHGHRNEWFHRCRQKLNGCELIFFDPDNGLERSVGFGRRHSHKFLYWTEVCEAFSAGASVLIYQHFPRENRAALIERLAERLRTETGAAGIFSFTTPNVLFLLAAHEQHVASFRNVVHSLPLHWPDKEIAGKEVRTTVAESA
jgi:hypothetical protein